MRYQLAIESGPTSPSGHPECVDVGPHSVGFADAAIAVKAPSRPLETIQETDGVGYYVRPSRFRHVYVEQARGVIAELAPCRIKALHIIGYPGGGVQ